MSVRKRLFASTLVIAVALIGAAPRSLRVIPSEPSSLPPAARQEPAEDVIFGTRLVDRYRWMERSGNPEFRDWLLAQGAYARRTLHGAGPRKAYRDAFIKRAGGLSTVIGYEERGAQTFILEQSAGAQVPRLLVRESGRSRVLVDPRSGASSVGLAITSFLPSPDGSLVLMGFAVGGGARSFAQLIDTASGKAVGQQIERTDPGYAAWSPDGKGFFISQLRALPNGAPRAESYLNIRALYIDLAGAMRPVVGTGLDGGPQLDPVDIPSVETVDGASAALAVVRTGVARELTLWTTSIDRASDPSARWEPLARREDAVIGWALRGPWIYLVSQKGAPNGQVLRVRAGRPLSEAEIVMPTTSVQIIESIVAARDGIYVSTINGAYSGLRWIGNDGRQTAVKLPFRGAIRQAAASASRPDIIVRMESWVRPPAFYRLMPDAGAQLLAPPSGPVPDPARYVAMDIAARTADGIDVPLSVVRARGAKGPRPFLLTAYGSYGFAQRAFYNDRIATLVDHGAGVGVCHVRGGGEKGADWYHAGKDANKPNTWYDLIACSERLIRGGITTKRQLVIRGVSAGGIAVGRAMTERPDLFAGVIMGVPLASTLRSEFQVNGPANVPEFGSVRDPQGFRNLLAMDSYHAVRDGVAYPSVLLTTGLNDAFVDPWQPGKMAARLQASGSRRAVLLRVEVEGGHAGGPTLSQRADEEADFAAFLFWRAGVPAWQPQVKP